MLERFSMTQLFHLQNVMTFNKCSINGKNDIKSYGDVYDSAGNPIEVTEVCSTIKLQ